jgi:hypothetical protein
VDKKQAFTAEEEADGRQASIDAKSSGSPRVLYIRSTYLCGKKKVLFQVRELESEKVIATFKP